MPSEPHAADPPGPAGSSERPAAAPAEALDGLLALPPARFTPDLLLRLAEGAARSVSGEAARKAASVGITLELPAALRAGVAGHVASAGEPLLAWLVLSADPLAGRAAAAAAATAAGVIARTAADPALREAAQAARRRLLGLSAANGEVFRPGGAEPAVRAAPPLRAAPLRILRAPDAPLSAELLFRGLDDAFERTLETGVRPGVRLYRDVFVNAAGQVWTRDGEQVVAGLRLGPVRPLDEDALRLQDDAPEVEAAEFAARPADGNFFHWMLNRFPAFLWHAERGTPMPLIVAERSPGFVGESLAAASVPLRPLRPAPAVFVRKLYFSVQEVAALAPPGGDSLHARLIAAADAAPAAASAGPLLYLSRRDSGRRPMGNEAELERALRALGFDVVLLSGVPLIEQIRTIRAGRLVVAPHGAGLAHLVFARAGVSVLELLPLVSKPAARVTMAQISRLRGHSHCLWLEPVSPGTERWVTDLDALLPEVTRLRDEALGRR